MVWDINLFNKNSIFFTLSINLIISIILLTISFFTVIQMDRTVQMKSLKNKYTTINKIVHQEYLRFGFTNDLRDIIRDMNLILLSDEKEIQKIFNTEDLHLLMQKRDENIFLHILQSENGNFLHFQTPFEEFIIIDKDIKLSKYNEVTIVIFVLLLLMLLLIASVIYKKLSPLTKIKEEIENIGNENLQLDCIDKNSLDEVSLLGKALVEKSHNLNDLKTARDVFIRNIMHELKTPITKGRFLIELPNTSDNKEKIQKVFFQLESLINEFALIEEVIAKKENIVKKEIFFDDILENVLDILMIEDEEKIVQSDTNQVKLNVNFKLFSIVVKNLIDNAIKYSDDKKVHIKIQKNSLSFINKGKALHHPLEKYYEPFFSYHENNSQRKESFGLGLYIIKSILNAHQFRLEYQYEESQKENIFTIKF